MKSVARIPHPEIFSMQLKKVSFQYDTGKKILDSSSFLFPSSKMIRVLGHEGEGTTTVLRLLGGLEAPTQGVYAVNDLDVNTLDSHARLEWQLSVGFGFETRGLLSNYSLRDNLMLPLNYHQAVPIPDRAARVQAYLDHFGIADYAGHLPALTPASVRKACALARALILSPRLLILDSPADGLHRSGVEKLAELVRWHQSEMGLQYVVIVTEDPFLIEFFDWESIELKGHALQPKRGRS